MNGRRPLQIVLVSGRIGSGKTKLADGLVGRHGARLVKTRELIKRRLPRTPDQRQDLQRAGERLDKQSGGGWVAEALTDLIDEIRKPGEQSSGLFVLDAIRIAGQSQAIRRAFGESVVYHVPDRVAGNARTAIPRSNASSDQGVTWQQAGANPTERKVEGLASIADTVVDTDYCTAEDVLVRATAFLASSRGRLIALLTSSSVANTEAKERATSSVISRLNTICSCELAAPTPGIRCTQSPSPKNTSICPPARDARPGQNWSWAQVPSFIHPNYWTKSTLTKSPKTGLSSTRAR